MRFKILFCLFLSFRLYAFDPLFVSLGSHCEVANFLKWTALRTQAFPFDWIFTTDHQGFITGLDTDLIYFLDPAYLYLDHQGRVMNTLYGFQYRHDWESVTEYVSTLDEIQVKYHRRIDRFWNLRDEKVIFIRAPLDRTFITPDDSAANDHCHLITFSQSKEIKEVLDRKFPNLNYLLVIINYADESTEVFPLEDKIIEFKVRKTHRSEDYTRILNHLKILF